MTFSGAAQDWWWVVLPTAVALAAAFPFFALWSRLLSGADAGTPPPVRDGTADARGPTDARGFADAMMAAGMSDADLARATGVPRDLLHLRNLGWGRHGAPSGFPAGLPAGLRETAS